MVTAVAIVSLKRKKVDAIEFSGRGVSFTIDDAFSADASASVLKTIEKGLSNYTSSGTDAIRNRSRFRLQPHLEPHQDPPDDHPGRRGGP